MTGLQATQDICKRQGLRRADSVQECLQHIQRHAIDLADISPANMLQVAEQNIPVTPAADQAIGFLVENLVTDGTALIIPVYRVIYEHSPQRPNFDRG